MNWKEFFKPTKWKIILMCFLFLCDLSYLFHAIWISSFNFPFYETIYYLTIPFAIIGLIFLPIKFILYNFLNMLIFHLVLTIAFAYSISCLIIWIYNKVKKK